MSNEQQAQKPMYYYKPGGRWRDSPKHAFWITEAHKRDGWLPLYTAPPLRDLTDAEIMEVIQNGNVYDDLGIARAILAKAREKL